MKTIVNYLDFFAFILQLLLITLILVFLSNAKSKHKIFQSFIYIIQGWDQSFDPRFSAQQCFSVCGRPQQSCQPVQFPIFLYACTKIQAFNFQGYHCTCFISIFQFNILKRNSEKYDLCQVQLLSLLSSIINFENIFSFAITGLPLIRESTENLWIFKNKSVVCEKLLELEVSGNDKYFLLFYQFTACINSSFLFVTNK